MSTRAERISRPFLAKFDGVCAHECGSRVHPGDWVQFVEGALVHVDCSEYLDLNQSG